MRKRLFLQIILLTLIFSSIVITYSKVSSEVEIEGESIELEIEITNAYYTATNKDKIENDVIAHFNIDVDSEDDYAFFEIIVALILPSGLSFAYEYAFNIEDDSFLEATMYFYNHATEPGWYIVEITGIITDETITTGVESYTFDPPGESGDSDPLSVELQY